MARGGAGRYSHVFAATGRYDTPPGAGRLTDKDRRRDDERLGSVAAGAGVAAGAAPRSSSALPADEKLRRIRHSLRARDGDGAAARAPRGALRHRAGDGARLLLRRAAGRAAHAGGDRGGAGGDGAGRQGEAAASRWPSIPHAEAVEFFRDKGEQYKLDILEKLVDQTVTFYRNGDFVDLCAGPHVPDTGFCQHVKLLASSPAHWRGEQNPSLQRVTRHGVGQPRGAEELPGVRAGGQGARPPRAGRGAGPVQLPSLGGVGAVASQGAADPQRAGALLARADAGVRVRGDPEPHPVQAGAVPDVRALGALPGRHVHRARRGRRARLRHEADELPRHHALLQELSRTATATCRCAWRRARCCTATRSRARCTG